ncbi:unnamed protein product [Paramecium pentaurelia]|uniref:Uncharacterized protein n=1 Tax=Paramecium pentaurelia TaxID=43138 RepID=A0A8S1UWD0_9CILI|nr:unnamed protein product [Paramecium pentaurelia]
MTLKILYLIFKLIRAVEYLQPKINMVPNIKINQNYNLKYNILNAIGNEFQGFFQLSQEIRL